jgi:RsiW-degrading membrane proteinase PrsW (M82 family)
MARQKTLVATEVLLVGGLLAFVAGAWGIAKGLGIRHPVHLAPIVAVVVAAAPALLWLGYFYKQDRLEPEPKGYVFGVYLLGGFVAWPIAQFLIGATPMSAAGYHWYDASTIVRAVLVVGIAQEAAKFLVVRYSIYLNAEFDEPMDGIVYMTACGIGFATAENIRYLMGLDGDVLLEIGAIHVVVSTLAHACFAGVLGYALGRAKFTADAAPRNVSLAVGLVVATLLNAAFHVIGVAVSTGGVRVSAVRGLVWASVFSAVVFFVVSMMMRRFQTASSPSAPKAEAA